MSATSDRIRSARWLAAIWLLIAGAIGALWQYATTEYERTILAERGRELQAIAESKIEYLGYWLEVRRSNAAVPSRSPQIARAAESGFDRDGPSGKTAVLERLGTIMTSYRYEAVMLFDRQGRLLADVGQHDETPHDKTFGLARQAMAEGRVVISRVGHSEAGGKPHQDIDIAAPVIAGSAQAPRIVGALVLHADVRAHLDQMMRKWPTASESGEAVLVERSDGRIVFLNTLRHGEAAQWRWNLDDPRLPAAMAARGQRGVAEGIDYRGVPVLAALGQVPGMPWFVVAKEDREEILAPVRHQALWSGALSALLAMALGLALFAQWRRSRSELELVEEAAAKQALAASEARYRALFESSPDAIFVHRDNILLFANRAAARLFHADSPEALCGRDWHELIAEEDWPVTERRVAAILSGETFQQPPLERRHLTLDGRIVTTESTAAAIIFDGQPALLATLRDVSARKRAEITLRTFLEAVPGVSALFARDGTILLLNADAARVLRGTPESLVGRNIFEAMAPELRSHRREWHDRLLAVRQPLTFEEFAGGRWFEHHARPILDAQGHVERMSWIALDITERKKTEEALRESETTLRLFLDTMPGFAFVMDDKATVLYANRKAAESLGVTLDRMIGASVLSLLPPDLAAARMARGQRALAEGETLRFEDNRDGRDFETFICPIPNSQGRFTRAAVLAFDITERKQGEARRLAQAREQRDTLVREVHHRIKNHLQGLAGLIGQHKRQYLGQHETLDNVIAQITAIAVIHGLQGRDASGEVRLFNLLKEIVSFLGNRSELDFANADYPACRACPWRTIEQESVPAALVINELVTNAIKHGYRAGEGQVAPIRIRCACDEKSIALTLHHPGTLPEGFDFAAGTGLGTGLTLVRSLLPREGSTLSIAAADGMVETRLSLMAPVVFRSPDGGRCPPL